MSKRKHVKPVRPQKAVHVTLPKLIDGENYGVILLLLFVVTAAILTFSFPRYILAGVAFDFFLLALWQVYSGIALTITARKVIAKYASELEPALFYRHLAMWLIVGVVALGGFWGMDLMLKK